MFVRSGAACVEQFKPEAAGSNAGFGTSVTLSGDGSLLAVGATLEDSKATGIDGDASDNSATDAGAVYLFTRSGTAWTQHAYVKASNPGAGDSFGHSLALSTDGSTLAVGTTSEDSKATGIGGDDGDNSDGNAGAVYVYH